MDRRNGGKQKSEDSRLKSTEIEQVQLDESEKSNAELSDKFTATKLEQVKNPYDWASIRQKNLDHDARLGLTSS